ncbi:MAG: TIGR04211 family SH3 domain-containing protein [Syntrophobacteraceae bacterium]|nr:TIGR04211 family SH3 domain-containing protein [Syntrophobacteraceae bacterium]
MKRCHLSALTCLTMVLLSMFMPAHARSETVYVNDAHEIAMRSGPSVQNRVIRMLSPGTALELLGSKTDWSRIRLPEGSGNVREGWVLTRFLSTVSPETLQQKGLEQENASLKEMIESLEREKADHARIQKELQDKIAKLESSYESLKAGSSSYIKFKEEFDATRTALAAAQSNYQSLLQENENLRLSQKIKWFAAGAAVLVSGWALGLLTGRLQRKRRSTYRI